MPDIDILVYSPNDMKDFISFCVEVKQTGETNPQTVLRPFEQNEDGNDNRGVFSWLNGHEVDAAQFFHTAQNADMHLFIALIQKDENDDQDRPWFRRFKTKPPIITFEPDIAGIDKLLRIDGKFGTLTKFKSLKELLGTLDEDKSLEAEFAASKEKRLKVLKQLGKDPTRRRAFLAALRSDTGSMPREVFSKIKNDFGVSF